MIAIALVIVLACASASKIEESVPAKPQIPNNFTVSVSIDGLGSGMMYYSLSTEQVWVSFIL